MKALSNSTYDKIRFEKFAKDISNQTAQSILALVAYCMNKKWGCNKQTCKKRISQILAFLEIENVLGRELSDVDIKQWCIENIEIDVSNIHVKSEVKQ